ncbi:PREDICTED: uncharacterized protein LOC105457416 [Wasmannia auropunctata]|uniref:uncharacterized protein LOC105457416 n=1 Tax=Wasmannia auropunctata TaxID=64793 RepID=UPI0005EE5A99|nr:PREDICTED: uncharacterized protein LOC105457416 [Wasmannia auropunctata]
MFKVDSLVRHLLRHGIEEKLEENTVGNNINVTINQSLTEENNVDASCHHTSTYLKDPENSKDLKIYGADVTPQEKNMQESWIWKYCTRVGQNDSRKCNICDRDTDSYLLTREHLFREHGIYHDEDVDRSNLIWQYFTEEERYTPTCKLCNKVLSNGYNEYNLEQHIISVHPQIMKEIGKKIEHMWVSQHFTLSISNREIKCKICCKIYNMVKVDSFTNHLLKHGINEKISRKYWGKLHKRNNESVNH